MSRPCKGNPHTRQNLELARVMVDEADPSDIT